MALFEGNYEIKFNVSLLLFLLLLILERYMFSLDLISEYILTTILFLLFSYIISKFVSIFFI